VFAFTSMYVNIFAMREHAPFFDPLRMILKSCHEVPFHTVLSVRNGCVNGALNNDLLGLELASS
jgi:hypothetical protein